MLAIIFRKVDVAELKATLLSIPLWTAAVVILGYTLGQVLGSTKWWLIARSGGIHVPWLKAQRASFIGMFVNCFGLGMVGGDAARGFLIAQGLPRKTEGLASVVADRIHGLIVLSLIGIASSVFFVGTDRTQQFSLVLVGIFTALVLCWIGSPALLRLVAPIASAKISKKLHDATAMFPRSLPVLATISIVSLVFHLLQISLHVAMAKGLGADVPLSLLLIVVPLANIASNLPISWNGLGVREHSYTFFLTPLFLSREQALAFGALWILAVTVGSAIGGLVALLSNDLATLRRDKAAIIALEAGEDQKVAVP